MDRKQKQRQRKKKSGNPDFDMRTEAYKLYGVDLTQIPGLMMMVFMLFSEVGRDMSRWPTAAHFVSWLGLCPDNDISGGTANPHGDVVSKFSRFEIRCPSVRPIERAMREPRMGPQSTVFPAQSCRP